MENAQTTLNPQWVGQDVLHPVGLTVLFVCILWGVAAKGHYKLLALYIFLVGIPSAQRIVVAGLDFSFARIAILALLLSAIASGALRRFTFNSCDYYAVSYGFFGTMVFGIQAGSLTGMLTSVGYMIEVLGAYFLGRWLTSGWSDFIHSIRVLLLLAVPMAILFQWELSTGRNLFSALGGVPEYTIQRQGELRAQGPFAHPILAGVFWASLLPWCALIWSEKMRAKKSFVLLSIAAISTIVAATNSSTPILVVLLGCLGFCAYGFRNRMGLLISCGAIVLLLLHFVRDQPVWHLLSRIDVAGGSTGYHRYYLIDEAINRFDEWWLIGTPSTYHWGPGLWDVTNQYILVGTRGGALSLLIFVLFLRSVFKLIAKGMREASAYQHEFAHFTAGVWLFVHVASFVAVSYFGQLVPLFYLMLGACVSAAQSSIAIPSTRNTLTLTESRSIRRQTS